jgi:aryl-alcohol dehydrogenase-like predicted oxidoreductase
MEYRRLEGSGFYASAMPLGTMTFGGKGGLARSVRPTWIWLPVR